MNAALACLRCEAALEREDLRCPLCGLASQPQVSTQVERHAVKVVRCEGCGAGLTYDVQVKAPRCAFCASAMKLETTEDPVETGAQRVVPFVVEPGRAHTVLRKWLKHRGFFAPSDLASEATVHELRPLFWPAWAFRVEARISWAADSNEGNRRASWAPHAGQTDLTFDDVLVPASKGLTLAECEQLAPHFDLSKATLEARGPDRTVTERFELTRSGARGLILRSIDAHAKAQLTSGVIPGTRFRNVKLAALLRGLTTQRVLLPSYVLAYRYRKKLYRVVVHGQDETQLFGASPISLWKVLGVALASLLALAIGGFIALQT
jgi:hypothetical protein